MAIRLTPTQASKLGLPAPKPQPGTHAGIVAAYNDTLLERLIADLGKRNLRNQQDHETRFLAERSSAARHERRTRKANGTYHPA